MNSDSTISKLKGEVFSGLDDRRFFSQSKSWCQIDNLSWHQQELSL